MSDTSDTDFANNLLNELDARQDEVIRELDELNQQIERLMRDWTRESVESSAAA